MARKKTESRPAIGLIEASNIVKDAMMPAMRAARALEYLLESIEACDANGDGAVALKMLAKLRELAAIHNDTVRIFKEATEPARD